MRTLVRKELRALRPWLVFAGVLALLSVLDQLLTDSGPRSLASNFSGLANQTLTLVFGVVALALGSGVAVKERDEGTLAFLDALPLTRTHVFFAKLAAALLVLLAFPGFQFVLVLVDHSLARGSLDAPFHWPILAGVFLMQVQVMATFLAVGTLLGFARSFTWMLVGLLAVGLQRLIHAVPRAAMLDPLKLLESGVEGVRWRYDVEAVVAQGVVALASVLTAWVLFVRSGRSRTVVVNPRPLVSALVGVLTLASIVLALVLWWDTGDSGGSDDAEPDVEALPESAPASTTTVHYEFSYPAIESKPALALADQADGIYGQVAALLGAPDGGAPIFVDLSGSLRNTLGTAFKDRLRMRVDVEPEATLAHETAHVVARRLTGEEGAVRWSAARVLDEGLASWVEGHFLVHPPEDQLVLAALLDRDALDLSAIIDFDTFAREGDDDLKYAIGRGLIEAMVHRYGAASVGRLLEAFGDEKLPPKLSGAALWQATFQLAGMDLGLVTDDFFGALEKQVAERREDLDGLPRPLARLVTFEGSYGVEGKLSAETDEEVVVLRFRPRPDSPLDEYDRVWVAPGHVAWREAGSIQARRVCFQAGVALSPKSVLFEPWRCVPLSAAAPWEPPAQAGPDEAPVDAAADGGASAPEDPVER
ncbi:MAG: ABC transporter permease subunit [Myxococcaceae bacterium]|nr:ABC transporter permease subunit [Myxococcaceae bacterium]